jgi:hypothetical protein
MALEPQITASSPSQVLARFRLSQMQFASTQLFQQLAQQTLQRYQLPANQQQLFAQP